MTPTPGSPADVAKRQRLTAALQRLDDAQLQDLHDRVAALCLELIPEAEPGDKVRSFRGWWDYPDVVAAAMFDTDASRWPAARWLAWQALAPLHDALAGRREDEEHVRVQVEANGHELILDDSGEHAPPHDRWRPVCWCEQPIDGFATRDAAIAAGEAHLAAHGGGRWDWSISD